MNRIIVLFVLLCIGLVGCSLSPSSAQPTSVQQFADQGTGEQVHLPDIGSPHPTYNSNPPTSGWHYSGAVLTPGIYTQPVPDTVTVHSLEHGMVIIHYRQDISPTDLQTLTNLARSLQRENPCLILLPRPVEQLDVPVAVTAWTFLLALSALDSEAITAFFRAHVGRGPEQVCPVGVATP